MSKEPTDLEKLREYGIPGGKHAKRPLDPKISPWHRQPGESAIAYADFMTYLSLPQEERTYRRVAEIAGKSVPMIGIYGARWSWPLRAAAYEEHYMLLRLESIEAERDDMFLRHRALAQQGLAIVEAQFTTIQKILADAKENGEDIAAMKPDALVRLFTEAVKADRQAVLGRADALADIEQTQEALAEKHAEELAALIRTVINDLDLTDEQKEQAQELLRKNLALETSA